ncbi:MAG: hypothetical protein NTX61_02360 [Bacteroidetes bacterium]|nr:hypothetical protein [Bacteroidota bacterium]
MYTNGLVVKAFLLAAFALTLSSEAQQPFPTGGYQGGTHGNVKIKTWSGAVDEKWNVSGNWCPAGVPVAQDDVVIPATPSIMPEVKVQGMACKNLTIKPGAELNINPGVTLTVNGHVTIEKQ